MTDDEQIKKVIAYELLRRVPELDDCNELAGDILSTLGANGYEIVPKKCDHSRYRGWGIDGRGCPDCGSIVVDPGD